MKKNALILMMVALVTLGSYGQSGISASMDLSINQAGELEVKVILNFPDTCTQLNYWYEPVVDTNQKEISLQYKTKLATGGCLTVVNSIDKKFNFGKLEKGLYRVHLSAFDSTDILAEGSIEIMNFETPEEPYEFQTGRMNVQLSMNKYNELIADLSVFLADNCIRISSWGEAVFDSEYNRFTINTESFTSQNNSCEKNPHYLKHSYNLGKVEPGMYMVRITNWNHYISSRGIVTDNPEAPYLPYEFSEKSCTLDLSMNEKEELVATISVTFPDSCGDFGDKTISFDEKNNQFTINLFSVINRGICATVVTTRSFSQNLGMVEPGKYSVNLQSWGIMKKTQSIAVGSTRSLCGDYNEDGIVDIIDALQVAQDYVGYPDGNPVLGDVNSSGTVDIIDALLITQFYVGLISSLSCDLGLLE